MNWKNIYDGKCPSCSKILRDTGDMVECLECAWKMRSNVFYAKTRRTDKHGICRINTGYFLVKHNSINEQEKMVDIARID